MSLTIAEILLLFTSIPINCLIKSSEVVSNGSAINYVIEYDGAFPDLFSQNTYSLFIEAECEPEGLNEFFNKPDCDCTENCEKICRTACYLK